MHSVGHARARQARPAARRGQSKAIPRYQQGSRDCPRSRGPYAGQTSGPPVTFRRAGRAPHQGRRAIGNPGASGSVNRSLRPDSVRHMSVTTAMQWLTTAHHDTRCDSTKTAREPGMPRSRALFRRWWQVLGSNQRRRMPTVLQRAHPCPSEWPLTCGYTIPHRVKTASCPCGVRSSGMCLVSATHLLDHVPGRPAESRHTQLSHCHPAIPCSGWAPHRSPDDCALRPHDRRMLVPHLRNPVWAAISRPCHGFPAEIGAVEPTLTVTPGSRPSLRCP